MSVAMEKTLTVNGKLCRYSGQSIDALITSLDIDPRRRGIAVAINETVVPRAAWTETKVSPGDRIEIVRPLAGG
jgi:sulfur carrier protein